MNCNPIQLIPPAVTGSPFSPATRRLKRGFDLLVSALLLVLLSPLLLALALLIRFDSPGPVIFCQPRVGQNGRLFNMFKLRTMHASADQTEPDGLKLPDDPRLTRPGRWLRRFSLDELPQLINVLRGEMSLVGPRPELPGLLQRYGPQGSLRLAVPQGMTGWWQINGRMARPWPQQRLADDLFYIEHHSLWLDVQILWLTVPAILHGEGAY